MIDFIATVLATVGSGAATKATFSHKKYKWGALFTALTLFLGAEDVHDIFDKLPHLF